MFTHTVSDDVMKAAGFAARAHDGQTRWGGTPYIVHPFRVAMRVMDKGEEYVIAALLHDVLEDTNASHLEMYNEFGEEICKAVVALTKKNGEDYAAYIDRCKLNPIARIVKLADLDDNTRSLEGQHKNLKQKYVEAFEVLRA